jgi:hypothetical protein
MRTVTENLNLLRSLWPQWTPNSEQMREWEDALRNRQQQDVEVSIRAHFRESRWREPKLAAILGAMPKRMSRAAPREPEELSHPEIIRRQWSRSDSELEYWRKIGDSQIMLMYEQQNLTKAEKVYPPHYPEVAHQRAVVERWQMVCDGRATEYVEPRMIDFCKACPGGEHPHIARTRAKVVSHA